MAALSARIGRAQGTAGLEPGRIEVDGTERTYLVRVPSAYQPGTPAPLVLVLHGLGGSGANVARQSGFADEAERGGFIAVFPDGRPLPAVGGGRGWALTAGGNPDLRFIAALLDRLQVEYSIGPSRVFVAGHPTARSSATGSPVSWRIVAALAVVAGAMVNNCAPSAPFPCCTSTARPTRSCRMRVVERCSGCPRLSRRVGAALG
jgi:polyhydroxybutyrate depolymerase